MSDKNDVGVLFSKGACVDVLGRIPVSSHQLLKVDLRIIFPNYQLLFLFYLFDLLYFILNVFGFFRSVLFLLFFLQILEVVELFLVELGSDWVVGSKVVDHCQVVFIEPYLAGVDVGEDVLAERLDEVDVGVVLYFCPLAVGVFSHGVEDVDLVLEVEDVVF